MVTNRPLSQTAVIALRAPDIAHDLGLQCFGIGELALIPHTAQEFDADAARCFTRQGFQQVAFDRKMVTVEGRTKSDVGYRGPSARVVEIGSLRDINAAGGKYFEV